MAAVPRGYAIMTVQWRHISLLRIRRLTGTNRLGQPVADGVNKSCRVGLESKGRMLKPESSIMCRYALNSFTKKEINAVYVCARSPADQSPSLADFFTACLWGQRSTWGCCMVTDWKGVTVWHQITSPPLWVGRLSISPLPVCSSRTVLPVFFCSFISPCWSPGGLYFFTGTGFAVLSLLPMLVGQKNQDDWCIFSGSAAVHNKSKLHLFSCSVSSVNCIIKVWLTEPLDDFTKLCNVHLPYNDMFKEKAFTFYELNPMHQLKRPLV